ncbi:uncharacterized protein LOC119085739 [Bradysia coprophila]|uniref:uncharacterized protein LOC119085739 n=1 Tax=Bradysia coprophila TaxID=38358 RepID=UPI00187DB375|nr:uncharacterized protein LOC119085739 [Bradysia coprophila]
MASPNDQVFGNISDHCISNIMKYLKPKDLLECGRACKRLYKLSRRQFIKKHSMREVQIRLLDNGRLSVTPSAKNFHYYGNIFRNVSIRSWNFQTNRALKLANLTNFMLMKCAQKMDKIYIVGDIELVPFGQIIQDRLVHVQTVEFRNRHGTFDEAQFLHQYCPNLNKLILGTGIDNTNVDAILQQIYKQLTHFYCLYGSVKNLSSERLEQFFENNNKIKKIVWKFGMCSDLDRLDSVDFIGTLHHLPHLQHFLFSFADQLAKYSDVEFEVMCHQLIELCNRDNFQCLELQLYCPRQSAIDAPIILFRMTHFVEMDKLTKIHLNRFPLVALIPTLRLLVNLRSLVLYDCRMNAFYEEDNDSTDDGSSASGDMDDPQMSLPQVQEIFYKNGRYDNLTAVLMLPIRHWRNLKRIFVPANYGISLDVAELNQARESLNNACEVNIFTNHKSLPTNLQYELVKLRCVDSINTVKLRRQYN